ncbi:MAG: hypothetical protein FWD58_10570, partial [Firmicutes bacterium]|nr:hypothetical protein [Bacillota bacterium]
MKKYCKIMLAIVLTFTVFAAQGTFLAPTATPGFPTTAAVLVSGVPQNPEDEPEEVKIRSEVDPNGNFTDNRVTIVLTKDATRQFKAYTPEDFSEIGCVRVTDLTRHTAYWVRERLSKDPDLPANPEAEEGMMVDVHKFRRILTLTLAEPSKENVISAIRQLERR